MPPELSPRSSIIKQRREQVADLVGQLGVALDVFAERRLLAAALAVEELLGQSLDWVARVAGGGHRHAPLPERYPLAYRDGSFQNESSLLMHGMPVLSYGSEMESAPRD